MATTITIDELVREICHFIGKHVESESIFCSPDPDLFLRCPQVMLDMIHMKTRISEETIKKWWNEGFDTRA